MWLIPPHCMRQKLIKNSKELIDYIFFYFSATSIPRPAYKNAWSPSDTRVLSKAMSLPLGRIWVRARIWALDWWSTIWCRGKKLPKMKSWDQAPASQWTKSLLLFQMHCVFIDVDFIDGTEASTYDREAWAVFAVFIKVTAWLIIFGDVPYAY